MYDGVPEALTDLAGAGFRLALATSKPTPFAERIVTHFGLAHFFGFVSGATMDGSRSHKTDIIDHALASLGQDAGTAVMVGDREQDVRGALASGVRSIGVGWGYAEPGELEQAGAGEIVATPAALVEALKNLDVTAGSQSLPRPT